MNLMSEKKLNPKRLMIWSLLVFVALGAWVSWLLSDKREDSLGVLSFPIESYHVSSALTQVQPEELDAVLQEYLGHSFWDLPLLEIQAKLMRLDWVVSATVSRVWPSRLNIHVVEQHPVARWGNNGLINQNGDVFYPSSLAGFENLVVLDGDLQFAVRITQRFADLMALFEQAQLHQQPMAIESLKLKDNFVWELKVYQGPALIFSENAWQAQIDRFLLAYPKVPDNLRNSTHQYDLRYSNGLAIQ